MTNASDRMTSHEVTHRDALAAIPTDQLLHLKAASDAAGLQHLAAHVVLAATTAAAILLAPAGPLTWLAMLAYGIVLVAFFAPAHEALHETAFRTKWLNRIVALAAGFLLVLPPRAFRAFHMAHHRHTQDIAHDPELSVPRPAAWGDYLWHLTGYGYWRAQFAGLLTAAFGRPLPSHVTERTAPAIRREARIFLAVYATVALAGIAMSATWLLTFWVLPVLFGQPFLRAYLLAEHAACPTVANMLANSRTTLTNRIVRFLAWNMPYHAAHHAVPTVPFHCLGELSRLLQPELKVVSRGYIAAHREIQATLGARSRIDAASMPRATEAKVPHAADGMRHEERIA